MATNLTDTIQVPIENEWPVSTLVAVCFIFSYTLLLIIVKILVEWSDYMKNNVNEFDLAIFKTPKPANSNNKSNEKGLFDNSAVRQHNLKALNSTGIHLNYLIELILKMSTICIFALIWSFYTVCAHANMVDITYPTNEVENVDAYAYVFVPVASIVGFAAVGFFLFVLVLAKIIFDSSDQYMLNNRYDLVIYRQVTGKAQVQQKQVHQSSANMHNLNAAAASGFDINMLNRNTFNTIFNVQAPDQ